MHISKTHRSDSYATTMNFLFILTKLWGLLSVIYRDLDKTIMEM